MAQKAYITKIVDDFRSTRQTLKVENLDIIDVLKLSLPLDFVTLTPLTFSSISGWLKDKGHTVSIEMSDRPLHGFITTYRGVGFIFLDGSDQEAERRYTIAHEVSHFILDYQIPRNKAVEKFGNSILEVLDGHREATTNELIDGLLTGISIQRFTHLLEKTGDGGFDRAKVFDAENDADLLALELLAPAGEVVRKVKHSKAKASFEEFQLRCKDVLVEDYHLPDKIAKEYSTRLAYSSTGGPTLLSKLNL